MKYLPLIASLAILASCSSNKATEENTQTQTEEPAKLATAKTIDPVCEMEKDTNWTDYVVNGTDTTWFCSAHCKDVYTAAPEKYKK